MKTFTTNWKRSYWPEPRFGKRVTRASVVRELRRDERALAQAATAERLRDALAAD